MKRRAPPADPAGVLWPSCGHRLLRTDGDGRLQVTDAFLRQLLWRPEIAPVDESCARERALHAALLDDPRRPLSESDLEALADPDARDSYRHLAGFRDCLLAHDSLDQAYLTLVGGARRPAVPPVLVDLLAQLLVREVLERIGRDTPWFDYASRVAELWYRPQAVALESGIVVADAERLAQRRPQALRLLQSLIAQADRVADAPTDRREVLDLLNRETLGRHRRQAAGADGGVSDLALDLAFEGHGLFALCRLLEAWVAHFHAVAVTVEPRREIHDRRWRWHLGLDAQSSRILDTLYRGEALDDEDRRRLLMLFELRFRDPSLVLPQLDGAPIYLGLAMDDANKLRLKPQNLLLNLPLAAAG